MNNYIIISPEKGDGKQPMFWRADCAGYTVYPFAAGIYNEADILSRPDYFNNGLSAVAIPLTDRAMETLGFKCSYEEEGLMKFLQKAKS